MLRGNHAARIDDKGRLKIPNAFRSLVEKAHGTELFVTSLTGEYVLFNLGWVQAVGEAGQIAEAVAGLQNWRRVAVHPHSGVGGEGP